MLGQALAAAPLAYSPPYVQVGATTAPSGLEVGILVTTPVTYIGAIAGIATSAPVISPPFFAAEISIQKPGSVIDVQAATLFTVTALTRSGTVATATTSAAHGYAAGDQIWITGATQTGYNGLFTLLSASGTTFTYTVSGSPTTPATTTTVIASGDVSNEGWDSAPINEYTQLTGGTLGATAAILVSDIGYRTAPTDTGIAGLWSGVQCYWPALSSAFQINRAVNLDPSTSGVAASWGTLSLFNYASQWDTMATQWNSDNRPVKIYYGNRTLENFPEWRGTRASVGTYIDINGKMRDAAINQVRWDYTTGSPSLLSETTATNLIANDTATPNTNGANTIGVSTDVPALRETSNVYKCVYSNDTVMQYRQPSPASFAPGASITASVYIWVPVTVNPASTFFLVYEIAGGTNIIPEIDVSRKGQWVRYTCIYTNTTGITQTGGNLVLRSRNTAAADVIYTTCWQIEAGTGPATSYIHTFGTTQTRATDYNYPSRQIWLDPAYNSLQLAFAGVATPWQLSDTALNIPIRDATYWLERPVNFNLYTGTGGTGGSEGVAIMAGVPKPMLRGISYNITPTLIDAINRLYQYNNGPGTIQTLYEGGASSPATGAITFQADVSDLTTGSTNAGQYRTCNAKGMFQLGSNPVHPITIDATGAFTTAGVQTNIANIARYMMTEDMLIPAANINLTSFTNVATAYPYPAGIYLSSQQTMNGIDVLNTLMESLAAKLTISRSGQVSMFVLRAIPPNTVPVATFDTTNIVNLAPKALPNTLTPPPYQWRVGYAVNWTVQTSDLNTGIITPDHKQYIATQSSYASAGSTAVSAAFARPNNHNPIGGALTTQANAQTVANDMVALWSTTRALYTVTLPVSVGITRDIGDVVRLIYPAMVNLASGAIGQIVGETFNSLDSTIAFDVLV